MQLFTAGLLNPLRTDVELQNPSNLQTAMSLARVYERRLLEDYMDAMSASPMTSTFQSKPSACSVQQQQETTTASSAKTSTTTTGGTPTVTAANIGAAKTPT